MRKRGYSWIIIATVAFVSALEPKAAEPGRRESFLCVIEENDTFGNIFGVENQDRHYTQGLKIMWIGGDGAFPKFTASLDRLVPPCGMIPQASNVGFILLAQNMYTPEDLKNPGPIYTDRPYAGWLYTGLIYQREGITPNRQIPVLDSFEVDLGVTGSASLAREAQRTFHDWIHDDPPRGWDHQIKTEPGLELKYARYWRLTPNEKVAPFFDFIPHVGCSLGNIRTYGALGGIVRFGYNLPQDFGPVLADGAAPTIGRRKPSGWFSIYGYGGAEGRLVAHNIFLDGNTYLHSLSVEKNNAVGDLIWGLAIQIGQCVELSFTGVLRSKEFQGQRNTDAFGSILFKAVIPI